MVLWEKATVPILSHGLSRGSAIFEVFGVHPGPEGPMAFRMDKHIDRLFHTADCLGMTIAYSKEEIMQAVSEAVRVNKIGRGLVKIMAYWSEEAIISLVLDSDLDIAIFAVSEGNGLTLDSAEPLKACFSKWYKLHPLTVPTTAKACAYYLNGMIARKSAMEKGFDIGILRHTDGFVAEGSIESVFIIKDGIIKTPPLGNILSSITRMSIIEAAEAEGLTVSQELIPSEVLFEADEMFICHTGSKIMPIKQFEDRQLPAPGPVTERLLAIIGSITSFKDDRFVHWFQPL